MDLQFLLVLGILAVAVGVLYRVNNRRAASEAARVTDHFADRGWQAVAVGDRVDRTDLRIDGTSPRGHRFVAVAYRTDNALAHLEAKVAFPDLLAAVAVPAVRRHDEKVTLLGRGEADPSVLKEAFDGEGLSHLDRVRGAELQSLKAGEGPVEFHVSRLATSQEHLAATVECLDRAVSALAQAGYLKPGPTV
jgi:hypothetical protein